MGIYDRDYYRREGPSFLATITEHGKVCKWLILVNVICFVLQLITRQKVLQTPEGLDLPQALGDFVPWSPGWFTKALWLDVNHVLHGEVWRLLTYAFLHDDNGIWHIVFNMLFLWWFGSDVEDLYGPREFLMVYLTAVVLGGVAFVIGHEVMRLPGTICVGASGGVMTVLVLCAMHYPTRVIYLFFFLPVPIWLFVLFEVAQDLYPLLTPGVQTQTAVSVHLAGAGFAFVYYKMQWRLLNLLPSPGAWRRQRARSRLRIYREEDEPQTPVRVATAGEVDEQLEARMDAVLRKVSDHGIESLSEQERSILLQASERLKRKRK
jgi:membrane associated rhomboid family serine protease